MRLAPSTVLSALLLASVVVSSCTSDTAAAPNATPAAVKAAPSAASPTAAPGGAAADDDCNLQTVLVAGVPGSPGHLIKSARNPNGDSELAVLMRAFVDDLREARVLAEGKQPMKKLFPTHRKMRCAWPTKPEERNEKYDAHAQSYLAAVRAFDGEPTKANYNGMIAGCVACHTVTCGGVLDFIGGMKWE
jgi:hypothetical protein